MRRKAYKTGNLIKTVLFLFLSGITALLNAQKNTGTNYVNRVISNIPDSLTYSTNGIAGYINTNFANQRDRSLAAYSWVTRNIAYDFDSILTNSIYETPEAVSDRILRTRTGVCLNFAYLFNEIQIKTGIKSFIVQGYTRQNGRVDFLPHLWCVGMIDSAWYVFDPTWGSGYNLTFFMASPAKMIHTHMPFDPMWQLLDHPYSYDRFRKGTFTRKELSPYFNFRDTIAEWENADALTNAIHAAARIEKNGTANNFIAAKLRVIKGDIIYLQNKSAVERYDSAVVLINQGIIYMNKFIQQRNEQFKTESDSARLYQLLDLSENNFASALEMLAGLKSTEDSILSSVVELKNEITGKQMMLNLQKAYLNDYFKNH